MVKDSAIILYSLQVQYQNLVNELIKNFIIFHEVSLLEADNPHPLPASFIVTNPHSGSFSEEVTSVHKKCNHITIMHKTTLPKIFITVSRPQDIFPNDGQGTVYEKYISNEPDVVE